jgi:gas vesicle protein
MMLLYRSYLFKLKKALHMGNKIWALALVGAAAYLFKTKKGNELRKQGMDMAGKAVQSLREKYQQMGSKAHDAIDAQTA